MKRIILSVLFAGIIFSSTSEVFSQLRSTPEHSCKTSAEEILSVIKSTYNLTAPVEGVLIVGEIRPGWWKYRLSKEPINLAEALGGLGGVLKSASLPVFLIRQSSDGKTTTLLEAGLKRNKHLPAREVILQRNDVVFVPRGCANGKLLPPTKVEFPGPQPGGRDYLVPKLNKPITK